MSPNILNILASAAFVWGGGGRGAGGGGELIFNLTAIYMLKVGGTVTV